MAKSGKLGRKATNRTECAKTTRGSKSNQKFQRVKEIKGETQKAKTTSETGPAFILEIFESLGAKGSREAKPSGPSEVSGNNPKHTGFNDEQHIEYDQKWGREECSFPGNDDPKEVIANCM